jgi:4-diphosphocytidyl-2-C-methyl-D-erythritol kinase
MAGKVTVRAPAKINLHLEVLHRREDGYHEIRSLFQAVSLHDELKIQAGGAGGGTAIRGNFDFPPEENIIGKAIELFRKETGTGEGIIVEVEKRIPSGAGMGGGSSDAAAVLRCLQALFDSSLSADRLLAIGRALGSDVPFFLSQAASFVEGTGEILRPIAARDDFAIVAVTPEEGLKTAEAYRMLDAVARTRARVGFSFQSASETYRRPVRDWSFFNDFDEVIFGRFPRIRRLADELSEAGALHPRLTGSGSTVIGVFPDRDSAESCARGLTRVTPRVLLPLAFMPALG